MFSLFHCCNGGDGGGGGRAAVGIVRAGKNKGRKEKLLDIAPPLLHTFLSSSSLAARSARTVSTQILIFAPAPDVRQAWRGLFFMYRTRYLQLWVESLFQKSQCWDRGEFHRFEDGEGGEEVYFSVVLFSSASCEKSVVIH